MDPESTTDTQNAQAPLRRRRSRRRQLAAAGIAALLSLTAACGSSSDAASTSGAATSGGATSGAPTSGGGSGEPIKVLAAVALTGPASPQGTGLVAGAQVAIDVVNKQGGVNGSQLELTSVDTKGDPAGAVTVLSEALGDGGYDLVITGGSAETLGMLPVLTRSGVISMGVSASAQANDPTKTPHHFNMTRPSKLSMEPLFGIAKEKGWDTIGVFFSNDALGQSNLETFKAVAAEHPDVTVKYESFTPTDVDLTAPLSKLREQDVDAVYYSTYGAGAGRVLAARTKLGWTVPIVGDTAVLASDAGSLVEPTDLQGASYLTPADGVELPDADRFNPTAWNNFQPAAVKQLGGTVTGPFFNAVNGYQMIISFSNAVKAAGSTDPDQVQKALESYQSTAQVGVASDQSLDLQDPRFTPESHIAWIAEDQVMFVPMAKLVDGLVPAATS